MQNTSSKDLATSDITNSDETPGPSTSTNAEYATIDRFKKSGSIYRNQPLGKKKYLQYPTSGKIIVSDLNPSYPSA